MAIVQFELDRAQNQLLAGHTLPRHTELETEPIEGDPCRFRTCYPVTIWPIDMVSASLTKPPFVAPATPRSSQAAAVLRLNLRTRDETVPFSALELPALRFFLKGQVQYVYRLYELIFNNVIEVAVAGSPDDPEPVLLDRTAIHPVGFGRDEGLLPYGARSFLGYRLLTEFFSFPEKFLFFELAGLGPRVLGKRESRLDVFLYLNQTAGDLERNVSAETFRLGCTPVVNLYQQRAEPIQLTQTEFEYRVVPDARRQLAHEIYSIDRVVATSPNDERVEFQPFFAVKHATAHREVPTFWYAKRRASEGGEDKIDHGTEVYLSLVDLGFNPNAPADWTVDVETTCLNRDLPHRLPFGPDQPHLQLSGGSPLVGRIGCLTAPTPTLRPALARGTIWRLISHLSLNHLSLVDQDEHTDALREILKLYDFAGTDETRKMIEGIVGVRHRRVAGRVGNATDGGICRGVEIAVEFDEDAFSGGGLYLFASVLERFFALYCSLNSFTRFVAETRQRGGILCRWPPRIGEHVLV
jgi:type VI secretion system protein ImpG